jgi:hypothetical protein
MYKFLSTFLSEGAIILGKAEKPEKRPCQFWLNCSNA